MAEAFYVCLMPQRNGVVAEASELSLCGHHLHPEVAIF